MRNIWFGGSRPKEIQRKSSIDSVIMRVIIYTWYSTFSAIITPEHSEKLIASIVLPGKFFSGMFFFVVVGIRGTVVNRTYGIHIKAYIFNRFYQHFLVLLTMVPRNSVF